MNKTLSFVGLGLAVALLLCLAPMPYGYYTLVRFVAMIVFGCMAFSYFEQKKTAPAVATVAAALLFQPFFKIALGRAMWNIVDVVAAVALIAQCVLTAKNQTTK